MLADAAAYFSQVTAVSAPMRAALLAYAKNTYAWVFNSLRTPVPTSVGRTAQGIYFVGLNRDPNVNASNNPAVNNGAAMTGMYDTNERYQQPQNGYFGAPIRGLSSSGEMGTTAMAALAARLYATTGTAAYATEAVSISNAFALPNAFGRLKDGLPFLGNIRDPWTNYRKLPDFWRLASGLVGFDASGTFTAALINSARKALASTSDGYLSANLSGEERNFLERSYVWEDTAALQGLGGGGQAHAQQIMTTGTALSVIVAALQVPAGKALSSSGTTAATAIEMLPALLTALRMAAAESFPRAGGIAAGRVGVKDNQFYLDLNGNGDPYINLNEGSALTFPRDPNAAALILTIGHLDVMSIDGNGNMILKGALTQNGSPQ